ncbi:MAG: dTMP kinase [bacterium]|nr:dTMP kinase [bacterium]
MSVFITFEGIEGSGKSSVIAAIGKFLSEQNCPALQTREPGGTELGQEIRRILLQTTPAPCHLAELLLFAADRAQHIAQVIRPALDSGTVVLSDRYADSTLAYQGYGRGVSLELLSRLHTIATADLAPDMTLLLDLPVQTGLERAALRRGEDQASWTRFEAETLEFHEAVRNGFLVLAQKNPQRFRVINASQPLTDVINEATSHVEALIKLTANSR